MVKRLKFRVYGGVDTGKYVYSVKEGCEIFLNLAFRPSLDHRSDSCMFLQIVEGKSLLYFLRSGLLWNGAPAARGPVELHPGHLLGSADCIVEILECPEVSGDRVEERTQFLELGQVNEDTEGQSSSITQIEVSRVPVSIWNEQSAVGVTTQSSATAGKIALTPLPSSYVAESFHYRPENTQEIFSQPPVSPNSSHRWVPAVAACAAVAIAVGVFEFQLQRNLFASKPVVARVERAPASVEEMPSTVIPLPVISKENDEKIRADLIRAIHADDVNSVRLVVEKNGLNQDFAVDEKGRLPASQAAALGRVSVLKILLSQKPNLNVLDASGYTPLMWAVRNQRGKTVDFLLLSGADPRFKRENGQDALALARANGNAKIQQRINEELAKSLK